MSKKHFNQNERERLVLNPYVLQVTEKSITYADEFKHLFIDQYILGRTPREIFEANGFDVEMLGMKRVEQCADRWKKPTRRTASLG